MSGRGARTWALALALAVLVAEGARGQDQTVGDEGDPAPEACAPPPLRPLPDYDGRPPPPPRPDERAAWIPRVVFYPLHLVAEYVVRRPLGFLVRQVDPERVLHFFRFGKNERITLAPTFSYDFGFRPNVGVLFRARDVGAPRHSITTLGSFGGKRWYAGRVTESYRPKGSRASYALMVEAISRPDGLFFGIGPDLTDDFRARYHWVGTEAAAAAELRLSKQARVHFRAGHRFRSFGDDVGSRVSIEDRISQGAPYGLPPGYLEGYSIAFAETRGEIDTRGARTSSGSGLRFTVTGTGAFELGDGPSSLSFLVYGGSLGGFVDLSGVNHVLSLTASAVFSDAIRGEIPFTELPSLGGDGPLGGFLRPFLIAESGAALSLTYTWPIWVFLDGKLDIAVGNAFDGHLDGIAPRRLRLSSSLGIAAFVERAHFLQIAFGIGTDEFADGPNVEQVRFVVGATQEF